MNQIHQDIFATATPLGRSGVAIIRLSGKGVIHKIQCIFQPRFSKYKDLDKFVRQALVGQIIFDNQIIDEVMLIAFREPSSFTGENCVEIHCHGNPVILKNISSILLKLDISLASPGEFSKRSYQSGKIDLSQAEAISAIIAARSQRELQLAFNLKNGSFRKIILQFRSKLLNLTSDLTAELDFIEEDIEFSLKAEKEIIFKELIQQIDELLQQTNSNEKFKKGIKIILIGEPNVGKSTLLNYFAGSDKAIVSDIPGTTRDQIEIETNVNGVLVTFTDTAGLHEINTDEVEKNNQTKIEQIGIDKTLESAREADLLLLILDGSKPPSHFSDDHYLQKNLNQLKKYKDKKNQNLNLRVIINKSDILHQNWQNQNEIQVSDKNYSWVKVSALEQTDLSIIREQITTIINDLPQTDDGYLLASWQQNILKQLKTELKTSYSMLQQAEQAEIICDLLQNCLDLLSQLTGEISNDELLGRIFSRFCIGK